MNYFTRATTQICKGAAESFRTFPAAMGSALAFAIVTMIRIQLEWPQQEPLNFLFNCLHWSFALGSVFSLTAITAAKSRSDRAMSFTAANLLGLAAVAITFMSLYFFGRTDPSLEASRYARVTTIAEARVVVAMQVSMLAFIVLAAYPKEQSDFARSFFMTHKAFFIAVIYGAVLMGGASGVAGAVQSLLYKDMSWKVYAYLGTIAGFLTFAIFIGYFPDFRKGRKDEKREIAQRQPRFVEILFEYIMIPIALALTIVLLSWAGKTSIGGMNVPFARLAAIASSYAAWGIWLHIMVTKSESELAAFYRRAYPFAALVILAFEAWALVLQIGKSGIKTTEYSFMLVWIIAASAAVMLIMMRDRSHKLIAMLACAVAVISVMPAVGYNALPVSSQSSRLERLLEGQGMLEDGNIVPARSEPDKSTREDITDAVEYLSSVQDAKLPEWFDKKLADSSVFKSKMGFEKTWPEPEYEQGSNGYMGTHLSLEPGAVDISGYSWAVNFQGEKEGSRAKIEGKNGSYIVSWTEGLQGTGTVPVIKVELDGRTILEKDMNEYLDRITKKYPPGQQNPTETGLEDMSLRLESSQVDVLLVFDHVDINVDTENDNIDYWFNLKAVYLGEK